MTEKPWEGRTVYCEGAKDGSDLGWIEVREVDSERLSLIVRNNMSVRVVTMTRDQAKTFAAHMMNLAGRAR